MTSFLDRLLGRQEQPRPRAAKAGTDLGPWATGVPLSLMETEPQQKAAAYLKAYKVGWFNKAGRKISGDLAGLPVVVSDGDADAGDTETTIDEPDLDIPFAQLDPIGQLQRLMERPNPNQTGRALRQKTQIRLDFGGAAFWYLENGNGTGLPTAIYGISPARMWPSIAKDGRLLGWVMDKDAPSGGVPFDRDEILVFSAATSDDQDWFGVSVVEAVYSQVPLTDLIARHTGNTLSLGGRLSGMLWPKERALTEDEFTDAQRAWRNVASDPNAARRMLIFPEPMEWAQGAATPQEIGIPELASLNRDEILTAFPISPYKLGVPTPGGLNSGEVRREDRKDYWEDTIEPRANLFEEVLKVGLLSRYEAAMGRTFNVELESPNLDDAPTLLEKAGAYRALISIGFDPQETVRAVELDHIRWNGLPDLLDPAKQAQMAEAAAAAGKPTEGGITTVVNDSTRRDNTQTQTTLGKGYKAREDIASRGSLLLSDFLAGQRERVVAGIRDSYPAGKVARRAWAVKADPDWWNAAVEDAELSATLRVVYNDAAQQGLTVVADSLNRIVPNKTVARITNDLLTYGGERIKDINARTLQSITAELATGTARGYTVAQLIDGVPAESFRGVLQVGLDNGVGVWGDARAETIARTETALSYNRASLEGYREFRVSRVTAIDGDGDPECAARNHAEMSIDDALSIADHPNGTLDWVPVTDKAAHMETDDVNAQEVREIVAEMLKSITAPLAAQPQPIVIQPTPPPVTVEVIMPDQVPPVVNVSNTIPEQKAPVVNVKAPIVNVPKPEVTFMPSAAKSAGVQDVRIVESTLPPRKRRVKRDGYGRVSEISEE